MGAKQELPALIDQYQISSGMQHFNPDTVARTAREIILSRFRNTFDFYSPFEIPVDRKIIEEKNWSIIHFRERSKALGLELRDPLVLYIDYNKLIEEKGSLIAPGIEQVSTTGGLSIGPIIVVAVHPKELRLSTTATTHHELAHYYSLTQFHVLGLPSPIIYLRNGAKVDTHEGITKGTIFEEGFAFHDEEIYINTRGRKRFPLDHLQLYLALPFAVEAGHGSRYLSTFNITGRRLLKLDFDTDIHHSDDFIDIYRGLSQRIPSFTQILERARATGSWNGLGKLIDDYYGSGAFRMLMSFHYENLPFSILQSTLKFVKKEITLNELGVVVAIEENKQQQKTTL